MFHHLREQLQPKTILQTDHFAFPGNKKLGDFLSRVPDWEAKATDVLQCTPDIVGVIYGNPPGPAFSVSTGRVERSS